jgi:hypothetical protein
VKRGGGQEVYCWAVFRAAGRSGPGVTSHWWMPVDNSGGARSPQRAEVKRMN